MRISDWSSDVCSSDLGGDRHGLIAAPQAGRRREGHAESQGIEAERTPQAPRRRQVGGHEIARNPGWYPANGLLRQPVLLSSHTTPLRLAAFLTGASLPEAGKRLCGECHMAGGPSASRPPKSTAIKSQLVTAASRRRRIASPPTRLPQVAGGSSKCCRRLRLSGSLAETLPAGEGYRSEGH